ncbi:L-rhamnose mutarotase [Niabella sp. W65]|nr:L-rhamnose mutarotase [Niabella sp. W65]MCH7363842.1 L-rhamnose mutarotase [Niabella sp. W65]
MQRIAFKMKLLPGFETEYKKRHDEIWPELKKLLHETGISDYAIFLDSETLDLIGILKLEQGRIMNDLPASPVMQQWWAYMADIMETHPDNEPLSVPLKEVFICLSFLIFTVFKPKYLSHVSVSNQNRLTVGRWSVYGNFSVCPICEWQR